MDTLTRRRTARGNDRGVELIELAIVLPILVTLLIGIVDFAFLFQRWEVVTNATREGARLASLGYLAPDVEARVQSYLDAGGLSATATIGVNLATTESPGGLAVNTRTVTVTYPSSFIFLPGTINLNSTSVMRAEGAGS
jgi:Flp pilus assembly protein TadG